MGAGVAADRFRDWPTHFRNCAGDLIMLRRLLMYSVLSILAVIILIPFAYLFSASIKTNSDFFSSLFLPSGNGLFGVAWTRLTLANYARLFTKFEFGRYTLNSFFFASVISVLATLSSAMGGFALAKYHFRGRRALTDLVLAAIVIPPALLLAPTYQMLYHLGLLDTVFGFILPAIAPAFGVYLFRPHRRLRRHPHLLQHRYPAGAADDRGVSSHHLPGDVEQFYWPADRAADARAISPGRGDRADEGDILAGLRFANGRHGRVRVAGSHVVPAFAAGIHRRINFGSRKGLNRIRMERF
jgi:hypothetical protein